MKTAERGAFFETFLKRSNRHTIFLFPQFSTETPPIALSGTQQTLAERQGNRAEITIEIQLSTAIT